MWRGLPLSRSSKPAYLTICQGRHAHYDIKSINGLRRDGLSKPFESRKNSVPANMPHPRYMDGEVLGYYSNLLARESFVDDSTWNKLITRSKQIYPTLEPKEIALILNSLARVRKVDTELFNLLCNQIVTKAHFYSSVCIKD